MAELTQGGAFLPPPIQYRVCPDPVQNRVNFKMSLVLLCCVALHCTCSSRALLTYLPVALLCCIALHLGFDSKMSLVLLCCVVLRCTFPLGHFSHIFPLHCCVASHCVALHLGFNFKMSLVLLCCVALHCTCSSRALLAYLPVALLCCVALHLGFNSKMS